MADFQCVLCLSSGLCIIHRVKERETERKIEEEGRQKDKRQQVVCLELSSFFALSVSQSLCLSVDLTALRSGSEVKLLLGQTYLKKSNIDIKSGIINLIPEVVQVGDLLHAEPAELTAADGAGHVIAAPVVHLDDVGATARAGLDIISWGGREGHQSYHVFVFRQKI